MLGEVYRDINLTCASIYNDFFVICLIFNLYFLIAIFSGNCGKLRVPYIGKLVSTDLNEHKTKRMIYNWSFAIRLSGATDEFVR